MWVVPQPMRSQQKVPYLQRSSEPMVTKWQAMLYVQMGWNLYWNYSRRLDINMWWKTEDVEYFSLFDDFFWPIYFHRTDSVRTCECKLSQSEHFCGDLWPMVDFVCWQNRWNILNNEFINWSWEHQSHWGYRTAEWWICHIIWYSMVKKRQHKREQQYYWIWAIFYIYIVVVMSH